MEGQNVQCKMQVYLSSNFLLIPILKSNRDLIVEVYQCIDFKNKFTGNRHLRESIKVEVYVVSVCVVVLLCVCLCVKCEPLKLLTMQAYNSN